MKKILLLISAYLLFPAITYAQTIGISRKNKPGDIPLDMTLGGLVANALGILYVIGAVGVLIFMVWGAMDWILAGGDKEKLAAARKKIMNSIIGLFLLALSMFIISLVGEITGINVLKLNCLPALNQSPAVNQLPCY